MSWNSCTSNNELLTNARAANAIDISGTIASSGGSAALALTNITVVGLLGRAP